jgi:cyclopropane-fatty-acyl-phospholipid synthase
MLALLIRDGELTVVDSRGRRSAFGNPGARPSVTVRLHNASLPLRVALYPYLAFGEAYVDGTMTIESGDLRQLLDLVTSNMEVLDDHWFARAKTWLASGMRAFTKSNDPRRSRRNVAHHYDLSGKLYDFFLDADHQYSCAYFSDGATTLEGAQAAKKRHIAAKLLLKPGQRVLDIGCGWGGLALDLARDHGVEVTGITLSEKQLEAARERAEQAGLADRVHFELKDYRSIEGRFDRIVSVGMFEHVGARNYRDFFAKLGDLLATDGVALLSSIGRMDPPTVPNAWIDKYIFPEAISRRCPKPSRLSSRRACGSRTSRSCGSIMPTRSSSGSTGLRRDGPKLPSCMTNGFAGSGNSTSPRARCSSATDR